MSSGGAGMLATLPDDMLAAALHDCCPIDRWVQQVLSRRPFHDDAAVLAAVEDAFAALDPGDWRAGLSAAAAPIAADGEAGTRAAAELALQLYRQRFGYAFVSGAPRMAADELLMRIRIRLGNDEEMELRTACDELRRIARGRLAGLLSRGAPPA